MKHNIPLPSTVHVPKLIAAPPVSFASGTSSIPSLQTHSKVKNTAESGTASPSDVKVPTTPTMGFFPPMPTSTQQNDYIQTSFANNSDSGHVTIQTPSGNSSVTYSTMSFDAESVDHPSTATSSAAPFDPIYSAECSSRAEQTTNDLPLSSSAPQSTCIPIQHK